MAGDAGRSPRLSVVPTTLSEASTFIARHHRHHPPSVGHKFSVAVADETNVIRGVAVVGRPVARHADDGWTLEVTRVATDGAANACSMLYAAAWRGARALGYRRLITYTLATEPGTSLRAAGWREIGKTPGRPWSCKSRPRVTRESTLGEKTVWEAH